jgi:type IV secretion system protein VirD4
VDGPHPVSLYLVVPPSDIARTKPLMRLVLNQIGRRLTESLDTSQSRQKLLLMLDEFAALGRLDFFESQLAFMAGYGIRSFLITQSLNQLERAYGPNHAILDNCHIRIAFSTNDERTAKRVSDALGTATEMRAMKNYAGHRLSPWLGHLMVSRQETSRPLLTSGEVMQLSPNEAIVMVSGAHPIRAGKVRYYEDPQFQHRILRPSLTLASSFATQPDDWSGCAPIPPSQVLLKALKLKTRNLNGGHSREVELPQNEKLVITSPRAEMEFDPESDDGDAVAEQAQAMNGSMQSLARSVSLDPDDDMGL